MEERDSLEIFYCIFSCCVCPSYAFVSCLYYCFVSGIPSCVFGTVFCFAFCGAVFRHAPGLKVCPALEWAGKQFSDLP